MKKTLISTLILLALASLAYSRAIIPVMLDGSGVSAGGTEYTVYITENTTDFNGYTYSGLTVLTGVIDTELREGTPTSNFGSDVEHEIDLYSPGNYVYMVIKFPTSSIPSGATVTAVELGLYGYEGNAITFKGTNLLRAWVESEATFNIWSTGNSWTTGGALSDGNDRASSSAFSTETLAIGSWSTVTAAGLVTLVQSWVSGTNNGLHLERDDGSDDSYYTRVHSCQGTNGYRPYLKIVYEN